MNTVTEALNRGLNNAKVWLETTYDSDSSEEVRQQAKDEVALFEKAIALFEKAIAELEQLKYDITAVDGTRYKASDTEPTATWLYRVNDGGRLELEPLNKPLSVFTGEA